VAREWQDVTVREIQGDRQRDFPNPWHLGVFAALVLWLVLALDRQVTQLFATHSGLLYEAASVLTHLGEVPWSLGPPALVFLIARYVMQRPGLATRALFVFASVATSGLLVDVVKALVGRARPGLWLDDGIYGFFFLRLTTVYQSFPSGHTACATGACFALAALAPCYRRSLLVAGLLIGLTRVVVTAHYLSDVLCAAALSLLVVTLLRRQFARRGWLFVPEAVRQD